MCNNKLDDEAHGILVKMLDEPHRRHQKLLLAESSLPREEVVARKWWSLPSNTLLPLINGGACQLLFPGLRGGPAGPDVRDAVLVFEGDVLQRVGAIEFHVRTSDWFTHGHHTDPRYNAVLLHIVLLHDSESSIRCQDGRTVPTCSLYDIPIAEKALASDGTRGVWPCHDVMKDLNDIERDKLLFNAGMLRFEQKTHGFVEQLHGLGRNGCDKSDSYSECLLVALGEGLAYGRDRAFFRATAQHLLGQSIAIPEPLGHGVAPSPLDARRIRILHTLVGRKQEVWQRLRTVLVDSPDEKTALTAMQTYFLRLGLSLARTDILICNVVLPFAAAIALLEQDVALGSRAQRLYQTHPGLSSNAVTRMMSTQLLLTVEPEGSCRQQGLHYIYQQTCQAKYCGECMMGRRIV